MACVFPRSNLALLTVYHSWHCWTVPQELVGASTANARQSSAGQMSMGLPNRPSLTEAVQVSVKATAACYCVRTRLRSERADSCHCYAMLP